MDRSVRSKQKLAARFMHLATRISLGCWAYVSNQQISEEWIGFALVEAREKWRQRRFRSWQSR
jgi:hypothetical protein